MTFMPTDDFDPEALINSMMNFTSAEREAVRKQGWRRVREAQQRKLHVPAKAVERLIEEVVAEVRRNAHQ